MGFNLSTRKNITIGQKNVCWGGRGCKWWEGKCLGGGGGGQVEERGLYLDGICP